jgi:hypothetical protein
VDAFALGGSCGADSGAGVTPSDMTHFCALERDTTHARRQIAIMDRDGLRLLSDEETDGLVKAVEEEKAAAEAAKRPGGAGAAGPSGGSA